MPASSRKQAYHEAQAPDNASDTPLLVWWRLRQIEEGPALSEPGLPGGSLLSPEGAAGEGTLAGPHDTAQLSCACSECCDARRRPAPGPVPGRVRAPLSVHPDWQLLSPTTERRRKVFLSDKRNYWVNRAFAWSLIRLDFERDRDGLRTDLARLGLHPTYAGAEGITSPLDTTGDPDLSRRLRGAHEMARQSAQRALYAAARAAALSRDLSPTLRACGNSVRYVQCPCHRRPVHSRCRQRWVCYECRTDWTRRTSRKLFAALCQHLEGELRRERPLTRWSAHARRGAIVVIITASVRQVGAIADRRQKIRDAWTAVRKLVHKQTERSWPYALVWEMTPGTEGQGNLHVHIAAVWPWVDWAKVVRTWRHSTHDNASHCRIMRAKGGAKGAAGYLAKYMSKGVEMGDFPEELQGEVLAANYNQRGVSTSHRFWNPPRKVCRFCAGAIRYTPGVRWDASVRLHRQREVLATWPGTVPISPAKEDTPCSS